jgi:general secretion pathway protein H
MKTQGFTLLEMLVVMFILGIVLALASVNFSQDPEQVLKTEAERLSLLLQQARDEAITSATPIAWRSGSVAHAFFRLGEDGKWRPMADGDFRTLQWPPQVHLAHAQINGVKVARDEALIFSPSGFNLPFELTLALNDARIALNGDSLGRIQVQRK